MQKLIIAICALLMLTLAGGVHAADKGEPMPGGRFSIGKHGHNTYSNPWMGLSFSAKEEYIVNALDKGRLAFFYTDAESLKRIKSLDFDKAWAFRYVLPDFKGCLNLYVINLAKEQENFGVVKDCDDYINKLIVYKKETHDFLSPEFSEVYDTVLGGRSFKALEMTYLLYKDFKVRSYVQQIGGFLVVVDMLVAADADTNVKLLDDYVSCFTKYNG